MEDTVRNVPQAFQKIQSKTKSLGFDQLSDEKLGSLLTTLCASKVNGKFLELGTGTGLSTAWMLKGMSEKSSLLTVDNQLELVNVAQAHLGEDPRVEFVVSDGEELIERLEEKSFDLIFADTWPGKYHCLNETLALLKVGGIYVIDDMLPQPNWPEGHELKVESLLSTLDNRSDLTVTRMCWSTGIVMCVKNA